MSCHFTKSKEMGLDEYLYEIEKNTLINALVESGFKMGKAAKILKIKRTAFSMKVHKKFKLDLNQVKESQRGIYGNCE